LHNLREYIKNIFFKTTRFWIVRGLLEYP
jgi:hypothetical protein